MLVLHTKNNMGHNSNSQLRTGNISNNNAYDVSGMGSYHSNINLSGNNTRMAALLKFIYASWSTYLGNIIGGSVFGVWLFVDFNDIKVMVLGIMAMTWAVGHGLISLYRGWIKMRKERIELQDIINSRHPAKPKKDEKTLELKSKNKN